MRGTFAAGIQAIVATDTVVDVIGMIRRAATAGKPSGGAVAGITLQGGNDVILALAGGDGAVVTTAADPDNLQVIHAVRRHRPPAGGKLVMTSVAGVGGRDMGQGFTAGRRAIMAGKTIPRECGMVWRVARSGEPTAGDVTSIAFRGRDQMIAALA